MRPITAITGMLLLLAGAVGAARGGDGHGTGATRPNVLLVLTDDQGYGDFSAHGNPVLRTPNIDRLRDQCVRLGDFHVAPMCTPTRGQLMSGRDAVDNGATSVTGGRSFPRQGIALMPQLFAAGGYRTGIFGKWHLGDCYPHRPNDQGFQEAYYHLGWGFTSAPEFSNTLFDGRAFHNGRPERFPGYCTDFWFDRAIDWMKQCQAEGKPFLCYLPTNAPHAPCIVAPRYSDPYLGKGPHFFFGMIANIDENMGRLEQFLEQSGLKQNTIVVFLTDNGGTAGVRLFNAGMRGGKTQFYEGGHRVPCFIRWPGGNLRLPGDIDSPPTQVQDLLPTLLEFCGLPATIPGQGAAFDGTSLAGLLRGQREAIPDRKLVVQYSRDRLSKWDCAVLWNSWRLVKGEELYHLASDPAQERNIAAGHPDVVNALRAHYEAWWRELEPGVNRFVPVAIIGSDAARVVELTSSDWQDVYADNAQYVRTGAGGGRGGPWNVAVERAGRYRVALRRWPAETGWKLASQGDAQGKAFAIARAKLRVGEREHAAAVAADASEGLLEVELPAGEYQLQGWFQNEAGEDQCGAFYATISALD